MQRRYRGEYTHDRQGEKENGRLSSKLLRLSPFDQDCCDLFRFFPHTTSAPSRTQSRTIVQKHATLSLSLSITPIKAFTASCRPVVFKSNRSEVSRCRTDARYPLPVPSRHFRPRFNFNFETNFGSTKRVSKVVVKHHLSVYTRVVVARRSIESDNRTKRSRIPIFAKSAHSRFTTFLRRK